MAVVMMMIVTVAVVVVGWSCVRRRGAEPADDPKPQHGDPDGDHEHRRDEVQPRIELSGTMNSDSASVISPSAKTPIVWVTVTIPPSRKACRAVPRVPTM